MHSDTAFTAMTRYLQNFSQTVMHAAPLKQLLRERMGFKGDMTSGGTKSKDVKYKQIRSQEHCGVASFRVEGHSRARGLLMG